MPADRLAFVIGQDKDSRDAVEIFHSIARLPAPIVPVGGARLAEEAPAEPVGMGADGEAVDFASSRADHGDGRVGPSSRWRLFVFAVCKRVGGTGRFAFARSDAIVHWRLRSACRHLSSSTPPPDQGSAPKQRFK